MPVVINRHHYHGRSLPEPFMYVGRPTALGNPFLPDQYGIKCLDLYREWLWERIKERDIGVITMLRDIREETNLVCSCAPRPCHADTIIKAWSFCKSNGIL